MERTTLEANVERSKSWLRSRRLAALKVLSDPQTLADEFARNHSYFAIENQLQRSKNPAETCACITALARIFELEPSYATYAPNAIDEKLTILNSSPNHATTNSRHIDILEAVVKTVAVMVRVNPVQCADLDKFPALLLLRESHGSHWPTGTRLMVDELLTSLRDAHGVNAPKRAQIEFNCILRGFKARDFSDHCSRLAQLVKDYPQLADEDNVIAVADQWFKLSDPPTEPLAELVRQFAATNPGSLSSKSFKTFMVRFEIKFESSSSIGGGGLVSYGSTKSDVITKIVGVFAEYQPTSCGSLHELMKLACAINRPELSDSAWHSLQRCIHATPPADWQIKSLERLQERRDTYRQWGTGPQKLKARLTHCKGLRVFLIAEDKRECELYWFSLSEDDQAWILEYRSGRFL